MDKQNQSGLRPAWSGRLTPRQPDHAPAAALLRRARRQRWLDNQARGNAEALARSRKKKEEEEKETEETKGTEDVAMHNLAEREKEKEKEKKEKEKKHVSEGENEEEDVMRNACAWLEEEGEMGETRKKKKARGNEAAQYTIEEEEERSLALQMTDPWHYCCEGARRLRRCPATAEFNFCD